MSKRCVFIDRDGVINVKQPDGQYVCSWDQFVWIPETIDWIRLFNALDFLVIVVTNQRGVARGMLTMKSLEQIHAKMVQGLSDRGAHIDDVQICPHEIDSCDCRKPRPGMVYSAQGKWDIDLSKSIMIGDSESDRQLAENCGLRFVQVREGKISKVQMERQLGGGPNVLG